MGVKGDKMTNDSVLNAEFASQGSEAHARMPYTSIPELSLSPGPIAGMDKKSNTIN